MAETANKLLSVEKNKKIFNLYAQNLRAFQDALIKEGKYSSNQARDIIQEQGFDVISKIILGE